MMREYENPCHYCTLDNCENCPDREDEYDGTGITDGMLEQKPPVGEPCEDCGEIITQAGYSIGCCNGCFEDDIRNYLSFDYR